MEHKLIKNENNEIKALEIYLTRAEFNQMIVENMFGDSVTFEVTYSLIKPKRNMSAPILDDD